jgi:predicted nucleic acid-binding protein
VKQIVESEKKSVYIESTIPSYATARETRDVIKAARQSMTKLFWEQERHRYELVVSQYVIDECSLGDIEASKKRLEFLSDIPLLEKSEKIDKLAAIYQNLLNIPDKAKMDCFHLAICVIAKVNFLLTWNCTHLGLNAYLKIRDYNEKHGFWTPLLVTPEYFINSEDGEENV